MSKPPFILKVLILIAATCTISVADVPDSQKSEVAHLLEFVTTSECEFERNGKRYSGEKAASHINRKYKHFRKGISSTEEFIEYSATKSTRSGEYYYVYCSDGNQLRCADWLTEELINFRGTQ